MIHVSSSLEGTEPLLQKLWSALRKQATSILAGLAGLALGAALIAIELVRHGWYLAAVGTLLLAGVGALALHKLGALVTRVVDVRKQVRALVRGTPAARSASVPAEANYSKSDLRLIGSFVASKPASRAIGRQAAAVAEDPAAPLRLFAATHGLGASTFPQRGRCVAVISPDIQTRGLGEYVTTAALHPSLSEAELQHFAPDTILIDERANDVGPWAGFLHPSGAAMFREVMRVLEWASSHDVHVHVITHPEGAPYVAPVLRAAANHVITSDSEGGVGILSELAVGPHQTERAGA